MFLRYRFVFPLLIAAVVTACSNTGTPPKADIHPAKNSPVASVSPLAEMVREAQVGNARAQHTLAGKYQRGEGVPKDLAKSVAWDQKSAAQGYTEAQAALAHDYFSGTGVTQDLKEAVNLADKAAAQGNAYAQSELGWCYRMGSGCPIDAAKSSEWFQKSAAQGYGDAQYALAICYEFGNGCPEDPSKAGEWGSKAVETLRKAAAQGDAHAQADLAFLYGRGIGIPIDSIQSAEWDQKAAAQGIDTAQINLAFDYLRGNGVVKDEAKALEWFQKAAVQGNQSAQFILAKEYAEGTAVEINLVSAYAWANLAASNVNEMNQSTDRKDAAHFRDQLEDQMTRAQVAEAQRLSANWKIGSDFPQEQSQQSPTGLPKTVGHPTKQGTGTMFVVTPTGLAVTNDHVLKGCLELRLKGQDSALKVVAEDAANDLALLQLPSPAAAVATIAESDKLRQGDDIAVFGFPLNGVLASGGNLTTGVISGLTGPRNNTAQFQITAAIQPGSSGSPVINDDGDVIGAVSSKLSDEVMARATGSVGESVNFAISAQELKAFLEANRVTYATGDGHWYARKQAPADIADAARKWTFMVECWK
jgi:hypothetical protein